MEGEGIKKRHGDSSGDPARIKACFSLSPGDTTTPPHMLFSSWYEPNSTQTPLSNVSNTTHNLHISPELHSSHDLLSKYFGTSIFLELSKMIILSLGGEPSNKYSSQVVKSSKVRFYLFI